MSASFLGCGERPVLAFGPNPPSGPAAQKGKTFADAVRGENVERVPPVFTHRFSGRVRKKSASDSPRSGYNSEVTRFGGSIEHNSGVEM